VTDNYKEKVKVKCVDILTGEIIPFYVTGADPRVIKIKRRRD
jgi:hypothetical protein